jgi:hypothetical protein
MAELEFYSKQGQWLLETTVPVGQWLMDTLPKLVIGSHEPRSLAQLQTDYEAAGLGRFEPFTQSLVWAQLRENGLLIV